MERHRWLCNILLCLALNSLLSLLTACGSRAIPEVAPQDAPTLTETVLPTAPQTLTSTPIPPTPTVIPIPATDTPNPTKEASSQSEQTGLPDLAVGWYPDVVFNPGTCGWNGGQITVSFDNMGATDAGPFAVSIQGQVVRLDGLPAGSSADASVQYDSVLGGISAMVDSTDAVVESDETNNFVGATFTPPPTCTTTLISTPTMTATPMP